MMLRIFIYFFVTLVLSKNGINAQPLRQLIEKKADSIDNYVMDEMKKRQIPGLAFGISDKNGLVKIKSYGFADLQNQALVRDNTVFELASLTKQFTAAAILLLVQQHKIKLSDPISLYFKDFPARWNKITIRHLLTHTSGLPAIGHGYTGFAKMDSSRLMELLGTNLSKELAFSAMKTDTLDFNPGERFSYSDVGYELLGHIINKVTGSYRYFIQENIFDKAGMKDSYILDQTTVHPFEARGYTLRNGKPVNIRRVWDVEIPSHSGIFSTIKDLNKWDSLLNTEALLSDQSKKSMWAQTRLNNGDFTNYGFGWFVRKMRQSLLVSHSGITGTEYLKYVGDSVSVIVLTNLGLGVYDHVNSWGIAPHIGKMLLGYNTFIDSNYITGSGLTVKKTRKNNSQKLVGTYEFSESKARRKIYFENGKLIYDKGATREELAELSDGSFIKLGLEYEEIMEVMSGDFKKLKWKGDTELLVRVN